MSNENEQEPIEVPLGNSGLFAWVDEEDRNILEETWNAKSAGTKEFPYYYAHRQYRIGGRLIDEFLHNVIWERMMNAPKPGGFVVDHINGDKLDNRRCNLRLASYADNNANKRKRRTNATSKYKGVVKCKNRNKPWRAVITLYGKQKALGYFAEERAAAIAYNKAALEHFGEFAYLNKVDEEDE